MIDRVGNVDTTRAARGADLAVLSAQLAGLIEDGSEAVGGWRNTVPDALAALLSEHGIDDMGMAMNRAPLADALAIGAAGWPDQIIAQLAERAAHGESVELAAGAHRRPGVGRHHGSQRTQT